LTEKDYLDARATCLRNMRAEGIDMLMEKNRLDTIVTISAGPAWIINQEHGDAYTGSSTTPAAIAGYPSVSVPAGEISGLPVGLSFTGKAWSDARQIAFAADFELRTHARRLPKFVPSAAGLEVR
jgi:amidase